MDSPFAEVFNNLAASAAAQSAARAAAAVQIHHYNALIEGGLEHATALELTEKTSHQVFECVAELLPQLARYAPNIVDAANKFQALQDHHDGDKPVPGEV